MPCDFVEKEEKSVRRLIKNGEQFSAVYPFEREGGPDGRALEWLKVLLQKAVCVECG